MPEENEVPLPVQKSVVKGTWREKVINYPIAQAK